MNRKISTLLTAMVFLCAMAVNAQSKFAHWPEKLVPVESAGSALKDYDEKSESEPYQIATESGDSVLYLHGTEADGYQLKFVPRPTVVKDSLARTLWCVQVTEPNVASTGETNYVWEFYNAATGQYLEFPALDSEFLLNQPKNAFIGWGPATTPADSAKIGGDVGGWAFNESKKGLVSHPLYTYYSKDSVVVLTHREGCKYVWFVKEAGNQVNKGKNPYVTNLRLWKAGEIILTAEDINKLLYTQEKDGGVKLKFNVQDNLEPNMLDASKEVVGKFFAENLTANRDFLASSTPGDSLKYVYLYKKSGLDTTFLKVDTTFLDSKQSVLNLVWDKEITNKLHKEKDPMTQHDSLKVSKYKGQYMFLFTYKPSVDSINVYVKQALWITKKNTHKYMKDAIAAGDTVYGQNVPINTFDVRSVDNNRRDYVLSVDTFAQNIQITFDTKLNWSCGDNEGKTSYAPGLYFIMNAKGEYLARPIHESGRTGGIVWTELVGGNEEQNPEHMPAYQWVVLQNKEKDVKSTLTIINREFAADSTSNVQLYKGTKGGYYTARRWSAVREDVEFTFVKVSDKSRTDEHLGYKYIPQTDLDLGYTYKFNYLHKLNMDTWLNTRKEDSVLVVDEENTGAFDLYIDTKDETYGVTVAGKVKDQISDLAQLKRNKYYISKGQNKNGSPYYVATDNNNRYAAKYIGVASRFYFKENNHVDDKHYYAFVDGGGSKAGVSDISRELALRKEDISEQRTSAFTVEVNDKLLYRAFNNAALGEKADNSADTLAFRDAYRDNEYLMDEYNKTWKPDGGITNYAGIWTAEQADNKIGFRIDPVRIVDADGKQLLKPQYLLSTATVVVPSDTCKETSGHRDAAGLPTDAANCVHATQGYTYGKYLVSFQDSVNQSTNPALYQDVKNGYTRVGFVPAIRVTTNNTDELIFLTGKDALDVESWRNGDAEKAKRSLNVNAIKKAYRDAGVVNGDTIYNKYVKNLKALREEQVAPDKDAHHTFTWSFRYVDPDKAMNATKEGHDNAFLIESANGDGRHIAPNYGAWMKVQNGCLVLTRANSTTFDAALRGENAMHFNAVHRDEFEEFEYGMATDNEAISAGKVVVIAGNGQVTINGAAGKKVVVSNILGQVVANTILTSDNATIAAPQGVVVVAVEGEDAVKAIVR